MGEAINNSAAEEKAALALRLLPACLPPSLNVIAIRKFAPKFLPASNIAVIHNAIHNVITDKWQIKLTRKGG